MRSAVPERSRARVAPESLPGMPLLAGAALLLLGTRRRGTVGTMASAGGAALLAAGLTPLLRRALLAAGRARATADVSTSIIIDRPVHEAFAFCRDFENFPRLSTALESVVDHGDGRSHWALRTRDGRVHEWDAIVTKFVPGQVLAWESLPGGNAVSAGVIRFTPLGADRTRLDLRVSFRPRSLSLGGAAGAFARAPASRVLRSALHQASAHFDAWDPNAEAPPPEPLVPRPPASPAG
jgi:uncharacterized membrane protein